MQIIGIDVGFGFTKATNGQESVIFKSIYGDATDIQFWVDFQERSLTEYFHVTLDGKSYFIGDLAEQQSDAVAFTLDQERMITDFARLFALTVTGLFLKTEESPEAPVSIVSGLPVGFYKQYHDRFRDALKGRHTLTYHSPDGGRITKKIQIDRVQLLPQPMGSVLNLLMNDSGKIVDTDLARQKIGIVDIGFRTTDYTVIDRLRYVERSSRTMDTGISKAYAVIANKLRENSGVNVELYRLYRAVQKGTIKMRGQGFNFGKIRDQIYTQLAATVAGDLDRIWSGDWDIETILITGGGCKELFAHLQPLITGNIRTPPAQTDPRMTNVMGYYKYGRYLWERDERSEAASASEAPSGEA
ncbi:MAG: ParM/StbA family protein [Desulfosarcina sp.]|nr:ParM/StbA family protein [Desulfobacterales bacterium]